MNDENRKTILLVEDETVTAIFETMILKKFGYDVIAAESGEKAIEIIGKNPGIDLILMDIDLGDGIDGTEAAKKILEMRDIPLIFLSSHTEAEVVGKTEGITSYGYIVKNSGEMVLNASIKMAFKLFEMNKKLNFELNLRKKLDHQVTERAKELQAFYDISEISQKENLTLPELYQEVLEILTRSWQYSDIAYARIVIDGHEYRSKNFVETEWMQSGPVRVYGSVVGMIDVGYLEAKDLMFEGPFLKEERSLIDAIAERIGHIIERKQAQIALVENEKKLNNILVNMRDVVWSLSWPDLNVLYLSPSVELLYGRTTGEFFENNNLWKEVIHPDDKHVIDTVIEQIQKEGIATRECRIILPDGSIKWIIDKSKLIFDQNNIPLRVEGLTSDITERKRAEEAMLESEERLRLVLEGSQSGFWDWNIETGKVQRNEQWAKMLGYTLQEIELTIKHWTDLQHPEDREAAWESIKNHLEGRTDQHKMEYRMLAKDGQYKWILDCARIVKRDEQGRPLRMSGIHMDITDQKIAENTILFHNEIMVNLPEAIYLIRAEDGIIVYTNSIFDAMFGYEQGEILGRHVSIVNASVDNESKEIARQIKESINKYGFWKGEVLNIKKDKSYIWCYANVSVFDHSSLGKVFLSIHTDITQRKLSEEKIKSLFAEKEFLLKELHHRTKNNMNTISNLLTLQAESLTEPSAINALNDAKSRVDSMGVLYNKLYRSDDLSKMSINDYLMSLVDEIVSNFPNGNLVKIEKKIEDFDLDVKRLQPLGIIINELLTNIMKYAFKDRVDGLIVVSASLHGNRVSLIIQDNGSGIPESIDFETSSGFGLMLVQLLTKQLKGTVRIERENGTKIIMEFER